MIGNYDLVVAALGVVFSLGTVGVCLYCRSFLRYLALNLYLLAIVGFILGGSYVISTFGYESYQYRYFYYTGDAIANIVGFVLIGTLFDRLLRESIFHKYVRPTLMISFLLIVAVSARFLSGNLDRFYSRFVYEFQQNIYFVGVLLTFLLWISMNYLQAESRRFVLVVSGLGIYFSSHAANYAMQYLFPVLGPILTKVPPLAYNFMVLLWFYSFWRVPEEEAAVLRPVEGGLREAVAQAQSGRE